MASLRSSASNSKAMSSNECEAGVHPFQTTAHPYVSMKMNDTSYKSYQKKD